MQQIYVQFVAFLWVNYLQKVQNKVMQRLQKNDFICLNARLSMN